MDTNFSSHLTRISLHSKFCTATFESANTSMIPCQWLSIDKRQSRLFAATAIKFCSTTMNTMRGNLLKKKWRTKAVMETRLDFQPSHFSKNLKYYLLWNNESIFYWDENRKIHPFCGGKVKECSQNFHYNRESLFKIDYRFQCSLSIWKALNSTNRIPQFSMDLKAIQLQKKLVFQQQKVWFLCDTLMLC